MLPKTMKAAVIPSLLLLLAVVTGCTDVANEANRSTSDTAATTTTIPGTTDSAQMPAAADGMTASNATAELVKSQLSRIYEKDIANGVLDSLSRSFIFSEQDLNGDGTKEILVGTRGSYFCGSGGCTILLLDANGKTINKFTVADYPVVIDDQKTNGWNNLFIRSGGKWRLIKYIGTHYPTNPSVQPPASGEPAAQLPRALDAARAGITWSPF